jgi:hypothetical protein
MNFYSDAKQDEFVSKLLDFKRDGYCVDIGSCHSVYSNNTFAFQELGWTSISVELESSYNKSYEATRKQGVHINQSALELNYKQLFDEYEFPTNIDYLSIDIDTLSYEALKLIPFDEYSFKVITIEHDGYIYGDQYRKLQRDYLTDKGYFLLCSNVYVEQDGYYGKECPFEDWWINKIDFDSNLIEKIKSESLLPSEIIKKFN